MLVSRTYSAPTVSRASRTAMVFCEPSFVARSNFQARSFSAEAKAPHLEQFVRDGAMLMDKMESNFDPNRKPLTVTHPQLASRWASDIPMENFTATCRAMVRFQCPEDHHHNKRYPIEAMVNKGADYCISCDHHSPRHNVWVTSVKVLLTVWIVVWAFQTLWG